MRLEQTIQSTERDIKTIKKNKKQDPMRCCLQETRFRLGDARAGYKRVDDSVQPHPGAAAFTSDGADAKTRLHQG